MYYYVMNKNKPVATFKTEPPDAFSGNLSLDLSETFDQLPIGFQDINTWLENRKSSKHSAHSAEIMSHMGCDDNAIFLKLTHAASINDTFWVRSEEESITWEQISLYQNQFNDNISKLSFNGSGIPTPLFHIFPPNLRVKVLSENVSAEKNIRSIWLGYLYLQKRR